LGLFDSIGSFVSNNSSWLNPLANIGIGAIKQHNADNAQGAYLDYLRSREQQNYQDSVDQINAYNAAHAGGRPGSSNAASVGAARATEANRQHAAKKALNQTTKTYKDLLAMYAPYKQTADQLLPQMQHAYESSLGLQHSLADFVNRPDQQAKLNGSIPAYAVNVPLPDSVRIK
jgi:hypothetical protein